MSALNLDNMKTVHPVDVIEEMATVNDWSFERSDEDQITICVESDTNTYLVSITWMEDVEALHIGCAFDVKVSDNRIVELLRLLNRINEYMFIGHFDFWSEESVVMYRHSLLLPDGLPPTGKQCETMVSAALAACEQYDDAISYVVAGNKTAREALELVMFETVGEA